jgi:hypothetical protein
LAYLKKSALGLFSAKYHPANLHIIIICHQWLTQLTALPRDSHSAHSEYTWGVQVLRSPNLFKKNYSPQEAENAVISQSNHPVDMHIFHNAHATIAWPQQTLL